MKDEIKKALEQATPGPWKSDTHIAGAHVTAIAQVAFCGENMVASSNPGERQRIDKKQCMANAHLIANAPTWLRWQNERIEQLEKALKFYASYWNHEVQLEDDGKTSVQRDGGEIARKALGKEE